MDNGFDNGKPSVDKKGAAITSAKDTVQTSENANIKPLYRGFWAEKIKAGDKVPVGANFFTKDTLDITVEVDTEWMQDSIQTFTKGAVDEAYRSGNEAVLKPWVEKHSIPIDPKTLDSLLQVQSVMQEMLEVTDESVTKTRKDHYLSDGQAKLSDFVGKSKCAEQAVVGKLLLDRIGIDSVTMGGVFVNDKDGNPDSPHDHVFLVLDDTQGDGSLLFDIARPKGSEPRGYPRILRSEKKLDYSTFEGQNNLVVPVKDIYSGATTYYGVGNPFELQSVNVAN